MCGFSVDHCLLTGKFKQFDIFSLEQSYIDTRDCQVTLKQHVIEWGIVKAALLKKSLCLLQAVDRLLCSAEVCLSIVLMTALKALLYVLGLLLLPGPAPLTTPAPEFRVL